MRAFRHALALGAIVSALQAPRIAAADEPFVDRPLTLKPFHLSADAGLGFGQGQGAPSFDSQGNVLPAGVTLGWGANFEAAVGLPFLGEVGVRLGYRFGQDGINAGWGFGADHFARLFDPVVAEPGASAVTNPEIRLRGTMLDATIVQVGLETRVIIPTDSSSSFELVPGVPVRIRLPGFARIDTGVWLPIELNSSTSYTIDLPGQLFFQADNAFFGPMTGIRFNFPGGGASSTTDVPAGIGGGYTLSSVIDLKVQVRTERINDVDWSKYIGGGVGVGLRLP
jgi:hypothetical protein